MGTITDEEGNFSIEAKPGDTLTISFIGYVSKSVEIIDQSPLTVRLDFEASNLDEVVVMGYGTTKKKDLTGSVTVMDTEELKKFPVSNIGMAMQGRLVCSDREFQSTRHQSTDSGQGLWDYFW
ncbi:carboxypeptidase-like regulatory domain-containing protein [Aquiflexum sp.]|uniref:carboxypeptidase-like regulatory domain-containing protein n=1 Tax=Aquiflexum sp. TaxID=1872584 RepID=UPI003593E51E